MPDLLVRGINQKVFDRMRRMAEAQGKSLAQTSDAAELRSTKEASPRSRSNRKGRDLSKSRTDGNPESTDVIEASGLLGFDAPWR